MRKTKQLTIDQEGRDLNKVFILTEMSAMKAESWATRALLALARSGAEIPEDIAQAGLAGVAALGMKIFGGVKFEDAQPLLNEMMTCVAYVPDPTKPMVLRSPPWEADIEEISTVFFLRQEVFKLHTDFSLAAFLQRQSAAISDQTPPS